MMKWKPLGFPKVFHFTMEAVLDLLIAPAFSLSIDRGANPASQTDCVDVQMQDQYRI
jgi:hypothetical protein